MKAVILAGGLGTRIGEETQVKPKPMAEIGGKPILWHIMKIYSAHGINQFIICLGYRGYVIKEYFANYFLHMSDITFDIAYNTMEVHNRHAEPWRVTLVDTGESTMTGGRIKRIKNYLNPDEDFCMTYGDGVADVDIQALIRYHQSQGVLATVTAVQPPARFGALDINEQRRVMGFAEKQKGEGGLVNGGYFILSSKVIDYIEDDSTLWEYEPMQRLAQEGNLVAYIHDGFWQPMDTLREKNILEELWAKGNAPWKIWN